MNLRTSEAQPLVINKLKVTVFVDNKKASKSIFNCDIKKLIEVATIVEKAALIPVAYNEDGKEIEDLGSFSTTEERSLYLFLNTGMGT